MLFAFTPPWNDCIAEGCLGPNDEKVRPACQGYTPRYDPAGLGDSPETRLILGDSPETRPNLGDPLVTRRVGQTIDKTQRPRRRLVGRLAYVLVGQLKGKGIRNISLTKEARLGLYL